MSEDNVEIAPLPGVSPDTAPWKPPRESVPGSGLPLTHLPPVLACRPDRSGPDELGQIR